MGFVRRHAASTLNYLSEGESEVMKNLQNEVRFMREADIPAVAESLRTVFNGEPWNDNWTEESALEAVQDHLAMPKSLCLVCFNGGRCVAASLSNIRAYSNQYSAYLNEFFVLPEYQGTGLATALFERTELEAKARGAKVIFFSTTKGSRAFYFYKKVGCFTVGDGVLFVKPLK